MSAVIITSGSRIEILPPATLISDVLSVYPSPDCMTHPTMIPAHAHAVVTENVMWIALFRPLARLRSVNRVSRPSMLTASSEMTPQNPALISLDPASMR